MVMDSTYILSQGLTLPGWIFLTIYFPIISYQDTMKDRSAISPVYRDLYNRWRSAQQIEIYLCNIWRSILWKSIQWMEIYHIKRGLSSVYSLSNRQRSIAEKLEIHPIDRDLYRLIQKYVFKREIYQQVKIYRIDRDLSNRKNLFCI